MKFQAGDKVKVTGEKGRAEATVVGFDQESGMYRLDYHAVEAKDDKGNETSVSGKNAEGFAAGKSLTKRR